jgi:hypothetical protein
MRECLQATMVALEEEYKTKEYAEAASGMVQDNSMAMKVAATLEDARAMLRRSATPCAPNAPNAAGGNQTNPSAATKMSSLETRKGAALEQFLR